MPRVVPAISAAAFLFFISASTALSQGPLLPQKDALSMGREIADNFLNELENSFSSFMAGGDWLAGIEGYSNTAQQITQAHADQTGYYIRRVSLKYRNPLNSPDPFEKETLNEFEKLKKEGKLTAKYDRYKVTVEEGTRYFRYMRPLLTREECLKCHGGEKDIPEEVKRFIKENYPEDMATGYKENSVRGAVSIKIPLFEEKKKPQKK